MQPNNRDIDHLRGGGGGGGLGSRVEEASRRALNLRTNDIVDVK